MTKAQSMVESPCYSTAGTAGIFWKNLFYKVDRFDKAGFNSGTHFSLQLVYSAAFNELTFSLFSDYFNFHSILPYMKKFQTKSHLSPYVMLFQLTL